KREIQIPRSHGTNVVQISRGGSRHERAGGYRKTVVVEPGCDGVRSATRRIAGQIGALIEVRNGSRHDRRRDWNARTEIEDFINGPPAKNSVRYSVQVHPLALADRQIVRCLPGKLILDILRAYRVLITQILPVLRCAVVKAYEVQRGIPVIGNQLRPGKRNQRGEMARQPLLHLGLQRMVDGVASRVAINVDAVAPVDASGPIVAAVTELRVLLERYPQRNGTLTIVGVGRRLNGCPRVGHHTAGVRNNAQRSAVLRDRAEIELV